MDGVRPMRYMTDDLRIKEIKELAPPAHLLREFPCGEAASQTVFNARNAVHRILHGMDDRLVVVIVPVDAQVDLRALGKRAAMADPGLAERTTGYVTGGISPLGQRRLLPTILDASALTQETILVSAGRRGLQIELAPADLLTLTGGRVASITRSPDGA